MIETQLQDETTSKATFNRTVGVRLPAFDVVVVPLTAGNMRGHRGMVFGSPLRSEIERRDPSALDRPIERVAEALQRWDGKDAPMSAHLLPLEPLSQANRVRPGG